MGNEIGLKIAIFSWGVMGMVGIPVLVFFDPFGGWKWVPQNPIYDQMIVSIYVTVGIFSFLALKDPLRHTSFLWFVVWSSVAHGGVMFYHALHMEMHRGHLFGDVWILAGAIGLGLSLWQAQRRGKISNIND